MQKWLTEELIAGTVLFPAIFS